MKNADSSAGATALRTFEHPYLRNENGVPVGLRTLTLPGQENDPLFIAKDVAVALGYTDVDQAVRMHCKRGTPLSSFKFSANPGDSTGSQQTYAQRRIAKLKGNRPVGLHPKTIIIPESDVYRLIMRSHLPAAERFQDWVVEDVLPAIKKDGAYVWGEENIGSGQGQESEDDFIRRAFELAKRKIERLQRERDQIQSDRTDQLDARRAEPKISASGASH